MKEELTGQISELVFTNESNYYCVLLFETTKEQFFAVGYMQAPKQGHQYKLTGEWKQHPKYGEQFSFSSYEELRPTTASAIAAYLSSGLIKGVGPATAARIVKKFGDETLKVIAQTPERLAEISGIGEKKALSISESYKEQTAYADTIVALSEFDIPTTTCMKLYKQYGADAVQIVKENPYKLIDDIYGIGFNKADKIAKSVGIAQDSPFRIQSGAVFYMEQLAAGGDTYTPEKDFNEKLAISLDVSREQTGDAIFELIMSGKLCKEDLDGMSILMLSRFKRAESCVASKLYELCNCELEGISSNADGIISRVEKSSNISLSETQKNAVVSSLRNGVSVITGGPGTGKTTIIRTILAILKDAGIKTSLAAPTGRAAKRMSQASGEDASTIHRLLEYGCMDGDENLKFGRNEENPLEAGCIIIDEASMIDILLMEALVKAIKSGCRLILVGDADQLPPVGAGNVLADILACEYIHSVRLTDIFRQAQESMIVVNAHSINKGEYPSWNQKGTDAFFLERKNDKQISDTIIQLCKDRLPSFYPDIDPQKDIQVLTPTRKGMNGSVELNKALQAVLNPPSDDKKEKTFGERIYRVGDKVMQNKNDYMLQWKNLRTLQTGEGVFNGDMGIIESIDTDLGSINVIFEGERLATYDYSNIEELETAFAMTVHKSQGSEFAVVIMPITHVAPMLATRNLLYTAITRAKQGVVLVGSPAICNAMTDNIQSIKRYSSLGERLKRIWTLSLT